MTNPWRIPLADIEVDDELLDAARETLASGWWSMGPRVAELEERLAGETGADHALAVSSGTAALHLALLAVGCGAGDEVVLPSLNFVAAANVVRRVGATPVFCDVLGPDDLNLDPVDLAAAVGPRTRAVIALHYGGFACDMAAILDIARPAGIAVIEDAAHASGGRWGRRALGTIGTIGCFSFFSNKNLPVGEGGAVMTSDRELADQVRALRSHGMTAVTWQRHEGHATSYDVVADGLNYRLDEVRAALALVQLRRLLDRNLARREHVVRYRELLDGVDEISFPFHGEDRLRDSAHHLAVALLPVGVSRDLIREALRAERIQTSVHYPPIHRFTSYKAAARRPLPRTDAISDRILTLPLYPHMSSSDVELVAQVLAGAVHAAQHRRD